MIKTIEEQFNNYTITDSKKPLIIVFANWSYLSILQNWIEGLKRLSIENYLIFSFDEKLHTYLSENNYQTILLQNIGNLNELWQLRIQVFKFLIDNNIDFIHSDADAVWLKNPIPEYCEQFREMHLLISQGTIWPEYVQKVWGFVLCCGFFLMRSSAATKRLLDKLDDHVKSTGDDQISMNTIIAAEDMHWDFNSKYKIVFGKHQLLCSNHVIRGTGAHIRIGVLPFRDFPRLPIPNTDPYVSHVLTPKESKPKIEMLRKVGAWFLDDIE